LIIPRKIAAVNWFCRGFAVAVRRFQKAGEFLENLTEFQVKSR
jgi:hypothetical protein